ncbi:MAG TPA: DUF3726 domain-containing protein [Dongiaceae bacterium]|jgi:hypothetical protein|nr:DUF3726 domain-containing protein [Dongiaceae bacterium]
MLTSLNEIEMTVWKAARGAGLSWGLAEEMAQAARWLADRGFAWAEPMVACLAAVESCAGRLPVPVLCEGAWVPPAGAAAMSPALAGPLLSDLACEVAPDAPFRLRRVAQPLLILPFAARAAADLGRDFILAWDGASYSCLRSELRAAARTEPPPAVADVSLSAGQGTIPDLVRTIAGGARHAVVPEAAEAALERWVHRTYVPASAESRLAGAGAGLTDND